MAERKTIESSDNILESLWYKFFPYWPLLLLLATLFLALGVAFTLYRKPVYVVNSTIVITSQENNRGYSNQPFQALNPFATTQIVDNEVLILQSRTLMKDVVKTLHLYAPVWEKRSVSAYSAHLTSPVRIEAQEPEKLKEKEKVFFDYDAASSTVAIEGKRYPLNQWIRFPFGTIRFVRNPFQRGQARKALFFTLAHPTVAAEQHTGSLKVASVSKLSTTINLSYKTDVPDLGETILNELLRQYLRSSIEHENALASSTLTFVGDRLREVERELDSIERSIQQFRTRTGAIDLSEQGKIYLQNVAETDRKVADIEAQLAVLDQVARYLNGERSRTGVVPTNLGIDDPVLAELLNQLNTLELQLAGQRTTMGANNPAVQSTENEIAKIRPNIQNIVRNQQSRLRASRTNLTGTSNRITTTIRNIPQQERELLEISRQQAVKRDLYAFLLQRREEAALSNSSSIANNRVVDWADANVATRSSGRIIILLGCLMAGLILGIAYVIMREGFSSKVLFRNDVEKLTALPVIGEITHHRNHKSNRSALSASLLTREINQLQAALGLFNEGNAVRTIMVTSLFLGEGASFLARNFARQLADAGKRVALLDLNLYQPSISSVIQQEGAAGFSDFIHGTSENASAFIRPAGDSSLHVMPAGKKADNPVSLFVHPRMDLLFSWLKSNYDFVVMDAPPLELTSEAYALARFCDATLLVARHGVTPKNIIRKLDDNPELKNLRNVNIVLNGIRARGFPRRYYGYGFGYGHEVIPKKQLLKLTKPTQGG